LHDFGARQIKLSFGEVNLQRTAFNSQRLRERYGRQMMWALAERSGKPDGESNGCEKN
jgi:hypothetical protein